MKRRCVIERGIGETRAALYEGRRLVELHIDRPSLRVARSGDLYLGQIKSIDPSVAGAWVDIGEDAAPALLPFAAQRQLPKLTEGQRVKLRILRSQIGDKGATVTFESEAAGSDKPGLIEALSLRERLARRFDDLDFDEASVNAVESACARHIALPGGGSITLEPTQALLAIDVDKGSAPSVAAAANAAAKIIAQQLRLRGLGGLVVIDFPNLRQPKQRKTLERTLESGFAGDPMVTKFMPLSRFGVIEMTRAKPDLSLDEIVNDRFGEPTIETQSLWALRRLLREAAVHAGAKLELSVTDEIKMWLEAASFDWQADVSARIGARFELTTGPCVEVRADR